MFPYRRLLPARGMTITTITARIIITRITTARTTAVTMATGERSACTATLRR